MQSPGRSLFVITYFILSIHTFITFYYLLWGEKLSSTSLLIIINLNKQIHLTSFQQYQQARFPTSFYCQCSWFAYFRYSTRIMEVGSLIWLKKKIRVRYTKTNLYTIVKLYLLFLCKLSSFINMLAKFCAFLE